MDEAAAARRILPAGRDAAVRCSLAMLAWSATTCPVYWETSLARLALIYAWA